MKIYTKTGDKGTTALIGGVRVPKNHLRIECYGTVDELNSYIGVVRDAANDEEANGWLQEIQDRLFTIGAELATAPNKEVKMAIPDLHAEDISLLEGLMDQMNETLPEMRSFILPGGNLAASHCHVARCVCRRAERLAVALEAEEANVPELVIPYLNRLSDFLFTLCRYLTHKANGVETPWRARM
ncbi:MAG: cob(I)yrinic acid a,c-diamide adenosyltransferase [Sphingobacteriales bacterium]|nr:MAG: cob(I)yrinic acid a,c-diamide adenosyltransferase [Sphingobacteriales bacterium]